MASRRCDKCGIPSFKTEQAFQRHIHTNKHIITQENVRKDLFQCKTCSKWYCGQSGLSHHKKICNFKKLNKKPIILEQLGATSAQEIINLQQPEPEQNKLDIIIEKERNVQNALIETMQQQINECKEEQKKMKDKIAVLEHNANKSTSQCLTQHQKSRDKRKKINKDVRKQIADNQENSCGDCKLVLSPYFEIDHIIGLQFGGTDDVSNLMALCRDCHAMKSIAENQCREQIKDAIQSIVREKLGIDRRV